MFSRDGSLLPFNYADARYIDDVIVFKGPGWKPSTKTVRSEQARRAEGASHPRHAGWQHAERLGWVPEANPFAAQWLSVPLNPSGHSKTAVSVDLALLDGMTPLAIRLAWVLFDASGHARYASL